MHTHAAATSMDAKHTSTCELFVAHVRHQRHAAAQSWPLQWEVASASACLCVVRERIVLVTTVRSANANAHNRNKTERRVVSYFASAMASTAACRSAPNFVPINALDAFDCACAAASRPRALATCVASRAPPNPHDAPTCRKSATNAPNRDAAAATMRALLDALPAACGSYSPTATLNRPRTPIRKHHH